MNNDNDKETKESFIEVFKRNYNNVPGFKELVKLGLYILVFVIFVGIMSGTINNRKQHDQKDETTTVAALKYQDMLNDLLDNKEANITININDAKYIINDEFGNNILTGTIDSIEGTSKFKIKDDLVYEIILEEEVLNDQLLSNVDTSIIRNNILVDIIKNNSAHKFENDDNITYKYSNVVINNITYNIDVIVVNNKIQNINLTSDNISYTINYI